MLITQEGMIIRLNVSGVREVGRSAQGVKLMNLDAEDRIVAVAKLAEKDEETEIELAKADGGPVPAELELEAAEEPDDDDELADPRRLRTSRSDDDEDDERRRARRDGALKTVGAVAGRGQPRPVDFCPVLPGHAPSGARHPGKGGPAHEVLPRYRGNQRDRDRPRMGHGRRRHHQSVADRQVGPAVPADRAGDRQAGARARSRARCWRPSTRRSSPRAGASPGLAENVVVKVPLTPAGLRAVATFKKEGIRTNVTLCFSAAQALLAAKAGAAYISPFVGRLDDIGEDGMELIEQVVTIYHNYGFDTKVLVASVRTRSTSCRRPCWGRTWPRCRSRCWSSSTSTR